MKVLAVHPDVIVVVSRFWQTTCTAVRAGEEGFVIDSPVYPDELEATAGVLEQAGFPVSGLLATHADWDHLLGRIAFPEASLGVGESTARRLAAEPGQAQRELREFDEEQYVDDRQPLALGGIQSLPVPGRLSLGPDDREIELHPADGHTADGTAFFIAWLHTLVCGDYLSPVEIPWISPGGSVEAYLATLERLRALVAGADTIVPGHGRPLDRADARRVLDEDVAYLEALRIAGPKAQLPANRRTGAQRRIHAENVERLQRGVSQ
ncbi:MAG TPA: MBL fold metallo-hydrolase [Solirubrobacteraceae bacterium]|nr:MBL fold metallo-hydrolase [Solirubrobacteraceae bacterium]